MTRHKADLAGTNLNSRIASALRDELLCSLAQLLYLWIIGNPSAFVEASATRTLAERSETDEPLAGNPQGRFRGGQRPNR